MPDTHKIMKCVLSKTFREQCVYIYIYTHTHMYIYIYIYTHTHTFDITFTYPTLSNIKICIQDTAY